MIVPKQRNGPTACLFFLAAVFLAALTSAQTTTGTRPRGGEGVNMIQSQEEAEIRRVETDLQEAWNRHDAKAFANLFAEDGDAVNVVGWWWKGRPEIEKKLTEAHAFIFRESTLTDNEVHVRFLTPQIAVVHVRWSLVGHRNPDGTPGQPRKGVETHVLQKQASKWLISAFHNTDSIPERPFPTGPTKK